MLLDFPVSAGEVEEPDAAVIALGHDAEAVVLDLVNPTRPGRDFLAGRGKHNSWRFKWRCSSRDADHCAEDKVGRRRVESLHGRPAVASRASESRLRQSDTGRYPGPLWAPASRDLSSSLYVSPMSGEPSNFNARAMARWLASRGRPHAKRQPPGPRPTLAELQRSHCWTWVYCEKCLHHAPMALVPLIIRWGAETSSDQLRQRARCTKCGHRGATLQHPGWAGTHIGFQPFPMPVESSSQS